MLVIAAMASVGGCLESPEASGGTGARADAPDWRVGDAWNYTVLDADGATAGWAAYEVLAVEDVLGAPAYRVREAYAGPDVGGVRERVVHYDVDTLNQVWDACGEPGVMDDCSGHERALDFPLVDGESWDAPTGGGVVIERRAEATHDPSTELPAAAGGAGEAWVVVLSGRACDGCALVEERLVYAPAVGLVAERVVTEDGDARTRWVLAETSREPT